MLSYVVTVSEKISKSAKYQSLYSAIIIIIIIIIIISFTHLNMFQTYV